MPPPVALAQVRELHLHPMRRPPHEVADGNMRRDFHEHMDMFSRQNAGYDLDAQFSAHLPDNRSYPLPNAPSSTLYAQVRALGSKLATTNMPQDTWSRAFDAAKDIHEERAIQRAFKEWADGDSIAAHIAYGIDVFCTKDEGKSNAGCLA